MMTAVTETHASVVCLTFGSKQVSVSEPAAPPPFSEPPGFQPIRKPSSQIWRLQKRSVQKLLFPSHSVLKTFQMTKKKKKRKQARNTTQINWDTMQVQLKVSWLFIIIIIIKRAASRSRKQEGEKQTSTCLSAQVQETLNSASKTSHSSQPQRNKQKYVTWLVWCVCVVTVSQQVSVQPECSGCSHGRFEGLTVVLFDLIFNRGLSSKGRVGNFWMRSYLNQTSTKHREPSDCRCSQRKKPFTSTF